MTFQSRSCHYSAVRSQYTHKPVSPEVTDPSCRLPLPTLFHRPEASHLGDLLRSWVRPTRRAMPVTLERERAGTSGFSRVVGSASDAAPMAALCRSVGPLAGWTVPGPTRPRQRETTTPAGAPADVSDGLSESRRLPGTGSVPSVREYRPDSLSPRPRFAWGSGSTHPRAIAVDAEPSSTSAFQGLVRIVVTTTKIGTGGLSGPARARTFSTATAAPSYSQPDRWDFGCDGAWVRRLSALHFQGRSLR